MLDIFIKIKARGDGLRVLLRTLTVVASLLALWRVEACSSLGPPPPGLDEEEKLWVEEFPYTPG